MIVVEDNGLGMEAERLHELRRSLRAVETVDGSRSIGLRNVDTRLRLHFGDRHRLLIRSRPGAGTTIALALPHPSTHRNGIQGGKNE